MHPIMKTAFASVATGMLASVPLAAQADFVQIANDTLSWSEGEIHTEYPTSWAGDGTSLEYTVYFDDASETWKYTYEWTTDHKSLSHIIFSLTDDPDPFDYDNFLGGTEGGEIKDYGPGDPSNPGIPGDMYGIKFDTDNDDLTSYFEIITDRGPMWGDFYAKGGVETVKNGPGQPAKYNMNAWNAGYGVDYDILFNPDGTLYEYIDGKILVPDSFEGPVPPDAVVPVPAAAWLFGSGLIGLLGIARRNKQRVPQG